jgi:non-specific serine/threonine protein kinase/serine/threonine-protein kinase
MQVPSGKRPLGDPAVRVSQDGAEEGPAKDQGQDADDRSKQNDASSAASGKRCLDKPDGEEGTGETASVGSLTERPETRVGRYRLLDVLGEGGTGIVYVAEQEEPIRRRVALKVIKPGMDSARVIACFEAERQALALLDHPNVAHVFDAGTTDSGHPYFVMEYVEGPSIIDYCDDHRLTVEERLRLFQQVCDAMRHAHEKGIIHRDIKPSNILVTVQGGTAIPKVIDFGIARAMNSQVAERTLMTEEEQLVGTPECMGSEQADMASEDIDTRSDTHSLGALLDVLLAGVLPCDAKRDRHGPAWTPGTQ